jgi:hypothetical protein
MVAVGYPLPDRLPDISIQLFVGLSSGEWLGRKNHSIRTFQDHMIWEENRLLVGFKKSIGSPFTLLVNWTLC